MVRPEGHSGGGPSPDRSGVDLNLILRSLVPARHGRRFAAPVVQGRGAVHMQLRTPSWAAAALAVDPLSISTGWSGYSVWERRTAVQVGGSAAIGELYPGAAAHR